MIRILRIFGTTIFFTSMNLSAATGEMGTGTPQFGMYLNANYSNVWSLTNTTTSFPTGCASLVVSAGTLGLDGYKLAVSQMTAARISGRKIKFYAHAARDGGCGVDYMEIQ